MYHTEVSKVITEYCRAPVNRAADPAVLNYLKIQLFWRIMLSTEQKSHAGRCNYDYGKQISNLGV